MEEGEAARERVLDFYCGGRMRRMTVAVVAGDPEPERFADRGEALAWLDGERAGLVAAVRGGDEERFADATERLADVPGGVSGLAAVLR